MATTILLADDSVTIQKVVELTFMDEDYEVVAVSNGEEAVARLAEVSPELVIADIHMPGHNGYEVCRRVKQWRAGTPVLLLVGTFEPFDENEAHRALADGHLKKPFDSQELLRRVEELLAAARAATGAAGAGIPADEMEPWQGEVGEGGDGESVSATGFAEDEPLGPLPGRSVPEELELEASPWTEAEEEGRGDWQAAAEQPIAAAAPPVAAGSAPAHPPASPSADGNGALSPADLEAIARRVVELIGDRLVREVAWEVIPDMAELVIKDRIRELERQLEGP